MAINKFSPSTKGSFTTRGGKRVFPPEWYAAQAARRKRNADGSYKKGEYKETRKDPDKPKQTRNFPESWKENQRKRQEERKAGEAAGSYIRKVRGKIKEYKEKGISDTLKGKREILVSENDAGHILNQLYKGDKAKIKVNDSHEIVSILGFGFYPGTKKGVNKKGRIFTLDSSNIVSAWL